MNRFFLFLFCLMIQHFLNAQEAKQSPRLFDTLLFCNEWDMLELRLREHAPFVDYFVIVEGSTTFTGKPKPLNYLLQKERYKEWHNKIIYISINSLPDGSGWDKEFYTRNYALKTLESICREDDIILHSDCDEIISQTTLKAIKSDFLNAPIMLELDFYYYNCNWKKKIPWRFVFAAPYSAVKNSSLLNLRFQSVQGQFKKIPKAGWHFSYFMTPEQIAEKIGAFSHTEYDRPEFTNLDLIRKAISEGEDLFHRGKGEDCIKASENDPLPEYINVLPPFLQRKRG